MKYLNVLDTKNLNVKFESCSSTWWGLFVTADGFDANKAPHIFIFLKICLFA